VEEVFSKYRIKYLLIIPVEPKRYLKSALDEFLKKS